MTFGVVVYDYTCWVNLTKPKDPVISKVAAIVGGVIGAFVFLILIVFVILPVVFSLKFKITIFSFYPEI